MRLVGSTSGLASFSFQCCQEQAKSLKKSCSKSTEQSTGVNFSEGLKSGL